MEAEEQFQTQKAWAEKGLFLMRELLPLMVPFAQHPHFEAGQRETIGMLLSASARSSESAFLLMAYGQLWDAEMVVRCIFEASLKFAYIVQSHADFQKRYKAYAVDHFRIALLKDDQKARDLLAVLPDAAAEEWRPLRERLLPDAELNDLRGRYDKAARRAIETEWSFTNLIGAMVRSGDPAYSALSGIAFGYSMSSHLIHADNIGVGMPLERDRRSDERRESIHFAHLARLISDCFACFQLRLSAANIFACCDRAPEVDAAKRIGALRALISSSYDKWMHVEYRH